MLYKNHVYKMHYDSTQVFQDNTTYNVPIYFGYLVNGFNNPLQYKKLTPLIQFNGDDYFVNGFEMQKYDGTTITLTQDVIIVVSQDTDNSVAPDLQSAIIFEDLTANKFMLFFIQNNAEPERVNKNGYLTGIKDGIGTMRESSSIVNPSITFEWDSGVSPTFNYVFIPQFGRFYFVTNITFIANKLWVMELNCDVLMSYKSEITSNTAYVERNENTYDVNIVDDLLTPKNRITITETEYTNKFFYTDITDRYSHTYESACPVVTAVGGISAYVGGTTDPNPDTSSQALRKLPWETFGLGLTTLYIMNPKALTTYMMSGNMSSLETIFTDLGEYIVGCKCFPFDVGDLATSVATDNPVKIGDKNATGLSAIRMNAFNNIKTIVSNFGVARIYNDFRDFAPYTKVSVFLPYIGYVDLPTNDVMGKTGMTIDYAFDLIDGTCQAFIRTGNRIIVTTDKCSCALDLPINQKNNSERLRNLALGSINILSGGIASAVGDSSGVKSLSKAVSPMMGFMTEHVTKGRITGGWQSMNSPTSVTLIVETQQWVSVNMTEFAKLHGRPTQETYTLSALTGFTKVGSIHLENIPTATESEIASIESLLKSGVIL